MIVTITGGRDFADRWLLFNVLDEIHSRHGIHLIRNGGMTGADALSSRWAYERLVNTECFGAKWGDHGKSAGPRRNNDMLAAGSDLLVAFPGGRGTQNTIEQARRLGIAVQEASS